ncbi:MAG: hypothetical protein EOO65_05285, partial [Methanosarcinales archaeon]
MHAINAMTPPLAAPLVNQAPQTVEGAHCEVQPPSCLSAAALADEIVMTLPANMVATGRDAATANVDSQQPATTSLGPTSTRLPARLPSPQAGQFFGGHRIPTPTASAPSQGSTVPKPGLEQNLADIFSSLPAVGSVASTISPRKERAAVALFASAPTTSHATSSSSSTGGNMQPGTTAASFTAPVPRVSSAPLFPPWAPRPVTAVPPLLAVPSMAAPAFPPPARYFEPTPHAGSMVQPPDSFNAAGTSPLAMAMAMSAAPAAPESTTYVTQFATLAVLDGSAMGATTAPTLGTQATKEVRPRRPLWAIGEPDDNGSAPASGGTSASAPASAHPVVAHTQPTPAAVPPSVNTPSLVGISAAFT